jgi:hypothetical protein
MLLLLLLLLLLLRRRWLLGSAVLGPIEAVGDRASARGHEFGEARRVGQRPIQSDR